MKLCGLKVLPDGALDNFECEQCGSIFINELKLEKHINGHDAFNGQTEKTPYRNFENKCDQCAFKGSSVGVLEDHVENMHKGTITQSQKDINQILMRKIHSEEYNLFLCQMKLRN